MRQYFDFSGLIDDYSNKFVVVTHTNAGYDKKGDYQSGQEVRTEYTGAIIAFRESKVLRSEGVITTKDRRLFTEQPLPQALVGAFVEYRGQKYRIDSELDNAEFTGIYSYLLKWVSAFDSV